MCLSQQNQGWYANLSLGFQRIAGKTVLAHRQRKGPLAVQRPFYPEGPRCHLYVLHPPGGVVGGDRLAIDLDLAPEAEALITTPGATKFYRSAGATAVQTQHIKLANNASLEWFPQENIFFPGANVQLKTQVDIETSARIAIWEIHCFGRPTIEEAFDTGYVDSSLQIIKSQRPVLFERLRLNADSRHRLSLMAGHPVVATLFISSVDETSVNRVRDLLPSMAHQHFSATLIEDMIVVRYLGDATDLAKQVFVTIWSALRLSVFGQAPITPRIWNT